MALSTMTNLRNIHPLSSNAAILPGHSLRFNIPGVPYIEPSSASVEPADDAWEVVHGVLYVLDENDFARICQTEGVPFIYALHRCRVIPYIGDGGTAGATAMENNSNIDRGGVVTYTLRAACQEWRRVGWDIPPSRSYLNVLIRGAEEFGLDEQYCRNLENMKVSTTWFGNGMAEEMLQIAELRKTIS